MPLKFLRPEHPLDLPLLIFHSDQLNVVTFQLTPKAVPDRAKSPT